MDYEKQTYLNTERLNDLYRAEKTVTASVPSSTLVGGIRFHMERAHAVRLEAYFPSSSVSYTPSFDGVAAAERTAPYFSTDVFAEKGEHVFDFVTSAAHGGAILRVTGVGVREGRRYFERVGGYYTASGTIVYMRPGEREVVEITCANGSLASSPTTKKHVDACLHYDKTNAAYTSTVFTAKSEGGSDLKVKCGQEITVSVSGLTSVAIADGKGLPSGHDCIVGYVDESGVLHFLTGALNGGVTASSVTVKGVKRVRSSSRGSVLLVEDADDYWKAYVFASSGDKSITVVGTTLKYTVLPVVKNAVCAPNATLDGSLTLYYKERNGALIAQDAQGTRSVIGYADAYYVGPCPALSTDNEIVLYNGE